MAKLILAALVLACAVALSSCSLIFTGRDPDVGAAEDRMEQIAAAVEDGDAAALKAMFSARAVERATGLDEGIAYFLSLFAEGELSWNLIGVSAEGEVDHGVKTWMVRPTYEVSAAGKKFTLVFADLTVNDLIDPQNVGLYALGAAARSEPGEPEVDEGLRYWNGFQYDHDGEYGYPGVYVPDDAILYPSELADARMEQIASALNSRDAAALTGLFSPHALDVAAELDERIDALLSLFPSGGVTWTREVVNVSSALDDPDRERTKLLTPYYRMSAAGQDYWVWFADYVINTTDPLSVGLAALAVTPWTEPGDPHLDQSFNTFADSWIGDDPGEFGIYLLRTYARAFDAAS